jgi:hypothetical protein
MVMVAMNAADRRRRSGRGDRGAGNAPGGIVSTVKEGFSGATRYLAEQARSASQQVKEATSGVTQAVLQTVQQEAERVYEKKKGRAVVRVKGVAKIGRQAAHALHAVKADKAAEYVEQASQRVGQATGYLEDHTLTEIMEDAADVVRRNQALAVGALFVTGFALTRFLKASASRDAEGHALEDEDIDEADEESGEIEGSDVEEGGEADADEAEDSADEIDSEYDEDEGEAEEDEGEDADAQDELESEDDDTGEIEDARDEEDEADEADEEAPAAVGRRRGGNASRDRARSGGGRPGRQ